MLYEGIKETENTRIEKDKETEDEIEMLYSFGVVLFEHTLLKKEHQTISICYFAPLDVFDVVVEDNDNGRLVSYRAVKQLDDTLLKYFNLIKNEELIDDDGLTVKCTSHSVEYTL